MKSVILVAIFLAGVVRGRFVRSTDQDNDVHQCEYNGKVYKEGEELPTRHMCLLCTCSKDFVEPNNFYCAVMDCPRSDYAGLGCQPIFNETECCPISWDCDNVKRKCECDSRYFQHYKVKGCTPIYEEGCNCPVRFDCPPQIPRNPKVCTFKENSYEIGDSIPVTNPCLICRCQQSFISSEAEIVCISVECPSAFRHVPLEKGCYEVYEENKCCPSKIECSKQDSNEAEKTCNFDGETYHVGQHIYPKENPCLICTCTENWNGIDDSNCRTHECMIEEHVSSLQKGCLPIYHESTCCPIEYYCGSPEEGFQNVTVPLANPVDIDSGNSCTFKGMHYKLGQVLDINHTTHCVTCTCTTPPDFTCIHKKCLGPPNNDYENCVAHYVPGQCCATYECPLSSPLIRRLASAPVLPVVQCSPVKCPQDCVEVTVGDSCPFCQCNSILCSPCHSSCVQEEVVKEGQCPSCQCPDDIGIDQNLECDPVDCPSTCYEANGNTGCPVCVCGPLCSPPKCDPGCEIQRNTPEGQCPGCVCENMDALGQTIQCSPVKCPPSCQEIIGDAGCPTCQCEACSPPKCEDGCYVDPSPSSLCPGCICPDGTPQIQCAPVNCGPLCHEAYSSNGCPTCICDPMCSPPKCDLPCHLDYNPATGPCPICQCQAAPAIIQCSPVNCGPLCHEVMGDSGCPTCDCGPLCSPPKCAQGCRLEYDPAVSPCPGCVCDLIQVSPMAIQCSPVKCDPPCREVMQGSNCPYCVCQPMCSMPKCNPGCRIEYKPDQCPTCACDGTNNSNFDINCTPVQCGPGCFVDNEAKPCPSCTCPGAGNLNFGIQCSMPKCSVGCIIDYGTKPCPSCKCDSSPLGIQCSMPKCPEGCTIDYDARPCPACKCDKGPHGIQCTPPLCGPGCYVDQNAQPCPSCTCPGAGNPNFGIQCSMPKCSVGCIIDYGTKPCPSCKCDSSPFGIQCSMPKCPESCTIDYDTRPCPSCKCDTGPHGIRCSPPLCGPGCYVDQNAQPCPSCTCPGAGNPNFGIQCSMPKCQPNCVINYESKPCPTCSCDGSPVPTIQCSPPNCGPYCTIDYTTKPCPSCFCHYENSNIQCSMPHCGQSCSIDYNTKPCPSCSCDAPIDPSLITIQCSPIQCESHCQEIVPSSGCPYCECVQCSPPRCGAGCTIDYNSKPCPSCVCGVPLLRRSSPVLFQPSMVIASRDPYCQKLKCGPGCHIDMSTNLTEFNRCPLCTCVDGIGKRLNCAPQQCELPCRFLRFSQYGCPSCVCHPIPCPPLNCKQGTIEKHFPGEACPRCTEDPPRTGNRECTPVQCEPACTEIPGPDGCPGCFCPPS